MNYRAAFEVETFAPQILDNSIIVTNTSNAVAAANVIAKSIPCKNETFFRSCQTENTTQNTKQS